MASIPASVLAINGGSSSIKFAVYHAGTLPKPSLSGKLDRIGRDGTTLSWRALLAREADDVRAAEAVALFCYQAKKGVCAFAAALGGLDAGVLGGHWRTECLASRPHL